MKVEGAVNAARASVVSDHIANTDESAAGSNANQQDLPNSSPLGHNEEAESINVPVTDASAVSGQGKISANTVVPMDTYTNNAITLVKHSYNSKLECFFIVGGIVTGAMIVTVITLAVLNYFNNNLLNTGARHSIVLMGTVSVAMFIALLCSMALCSTESIGTAQLDSTSTQAGALAADTNAPSSTSAPRPISVNNNIHARQGTVIAGQLLKLARQISEGKFKFDEQEAQPAIKALRALAQHISKKGSALSKQEAQSAQDTLRELAIRLYNKRSRLHTQESIPPPQDVASKLLMLLPSIRALTGSPLLEDNESQRPEEADAPSAGLATTCAESAVTSYIQL